MSVPNPLLGYVREKLNATDLGGRNKLASVLRMFVTMEPILAPPEAMQQSVRLFPRQCSSLIEGLHSQFDSTESLALLNHARLWVEDLNKKFPDREYKATVSDINGRAVFIPRFLRPLPLPPLPGASATGAEEAAPAVTGGGTDTQVGRVHDLKPPITPSACL